MFLRVCSTVFSAWAVCGGVNIYGTKLVPRRIRAGSTALAPKATFGCSGSPAAAALSVAFVTITMTHTDNTTQIKLITFVLIDIITVLPYLSGVARFDVGALLNVDCPRDQINLYLDVVAYEVWHLR